ncbi:MAG TPA: hypothetical protein VGM01_11740 [Ktedonobacteraceae bacterium]
MTNEEIPAIINEEYLYLYDYIIEGQSYNYWDYFKDRQEAERTILFWNAGAPYIKTVSLKECKNGVIWRGLHIPYKKSDYEKMHD